MAYRPLVAGNWKMNGLAASAGELEAIIAGARGLPKADFIICPPATLVARFAALAQGSRVAIGGQDCHAEPAGAFTGDISAEMLKDAGAVAVIVGHSERRQYHCETDAMVRAKVLAATGAGLQAIICVGETRAERDAGRADDVVSAQLRDSVPDTGAVLAIAYEPVWAIGTGVTPALSDIGHMHGLIRQWFYPIEIRILYGGSVKPANAKELLTVENVDGALVGGASLKADEFLAIAAVYR